jgi:DNA-binding NarL/FixJ family response regulator
MHESAEMASEALAAGARGLVYKSDAARDLAGAITAVSSKQTFLSSRVMKTIAKSGLPPAAEKSGITLLTGREREILRMLAEGQTVKKVADQLGISYKTVQAHRANIMEKLHLHSAADIIYFALRNHLVELTS